MTPLINLQAEQNLTALFINETINEAGFPLVVLLVMRPTVGKVSSPPLGGRGTRQTLSFPFQNIPLAR